MTLTFDMVLNHLPDGIVVLDNRGQIVSWNEMLTRYLNIHPGQAVGKIFSRAFPHLDNLTELEIDRRILEIYRTPMVDMSLQIQGEVIIFRDVTHQKHTLHAQQAQADTLKSHVKELKLVQMFSKELSAGLNIDYQYELVIDTSMRISHADSGFIALANNNQFSVAYFYGLYPSLSIDDILPPSSPILQKVIQNPQPQIFYADEIRDETFPTPDDWYSKMVIPLVIRKQFVGVISLDKTQEKPFTPEAVQLLSIMAERIAAALENARLYQRVQEQLGKVSQLEQLKSDMIRIAAHDLKNPLAVSTGFLELLEKRASTLNEMHKSYIHSAMNSMRQMQQMIQDILSLERIERMAQEETMIPLDLQGLVEEAYGDYLPRATEKSQTLSLAFDADQNYEIVGDPIQLREAITNLLSNAIKYTPHDGAILISLTRQDEAICLEVSDNGYGIPEDLQSRLFQPFYRAKTRETETVQGTGLGLHLVKNIIERHGGTMIFYSVYGSGSTFGFHIPPLKA